MFIAEAALGNAALISEDRSELTAPPPGHDSCVTVSRFQPDVAGDVQLGAGESAVRFATGKAVPTDHAMQACQSGTTRAGRPAFMQNEFVLYREEQVCLRYLVKIRVPQ